VLVLAVKNGVIMASVYSFTLSVKMLIARDLDQIWFTVHTAIALVLPGLIIRDFTDTLYFLVCISGVHSFR